MNWVLLLLVSQVFSGPAADAAITSVRFYNEQSCRNAGEMLSDAAKAHKQAVSYVCVRDEAPK